VIDSIFSEIMIIKRGNDIDVGPESFFNANSAKKMYFTKDM